MNPKQFLIIGGIILVLVGILGFFLIGPTAEKSIFKGAWWFDNQENWAHLILGIVALIVAFAAPISVQKPIVVLVGVLGVFFGVWSIFGPKFLGANLENPADTILHFVVGVWALYSALGKKGSAEILQPTV